MWSSLHRPSSSENRTLANVSNEISPERANTFRKSAIHRRQRERDVDENDYYLLVSVSAFSVYPAGIAARLQTN